MAPEVTFLNVREVARRIGVSRQTIYQILKRDPSFPRPVYPAPRAPRWDAVKVATWQDSLAERTV